MTVTEIVYLSVLGVIFTVLAVAALFDIGRVARRADLLDLIEVYTIGGDWCETLHDIRDLPETTSAEELAA